MSEINYDDKVDLQVATNIANINKVTASDMNEIKSVVNTNAEEVGDITSLTTTDKTNVVNAVNELNAPEKWVSVGTTAPTDGRRVWFAKGKNLFNKDTITTGKYITDTGGEGTNSTTFCSGFIKVQPSTTYYVSGRNNGWGNVAFYDENKTFISRINETNSMFTTTSITYYIRINGHLNDLDTLQIEERKSSNII